MFQVFAGYWRYVSRSTFPSAGKPKHGVYRPQILKSFFLKGKKSCLRFSDEQNRKIDEKGINNSADRALHQAQANLRLSVCAFFCFGGKKIPGTWMFTGAFNLISLNIRTT